jgi:[ribosomal protein S5]-alanine N-acetyltransferase
VGDIPVIQTDRLCLRAFSERDLGDLVRIAGNRVIADTTISVPHPFATADGLSWIARSQAETLESENIGLAVVDAADCMVGYVGLHNIDRTHLQAEIAFWIDPTMQGKGYAAEAARAMLGFAFNTLGLNRICAYHMVRNAASEQLLRKIGFVEEGYLRQRVRKWDLFEDVKLWALLR